LHAVLLASLTVLWTVGKPSRERRALLHPLRSDPRIEQESLISEG